MFFDYMNIMKESLLVMFVFSVIASGLAHAAIIGNSTTITSTILTTTSIIPITTSTSTIPTTTSTSTTTTTSTSTTTTSSVFTTSIPANTFLALNNIQVYTEMAGRITYTNPGSFHTNLTEPAQLLIAVTSDASNAFSFGTQKTNVLVYDLT